MYSTDEWVEIVKVLKTCKCARAAAPIGCSIKTFETKNSDRKILPLRVLYALSAMLLWG